MAAPRKLSKKKPVVKTASTRTTKTLLRKPAKPVGKTNSHTQPAATNGHRQGERDSAPRGSRNGKNGSSLPAKPQLSQKETLQQERVQVENELARLREELQQAPEMTGDEVDLNVYERERTLGLVAAYERRLAEIDAALRAAAQGKYGICERCGKPIPPERLQIFPETRLCVDCKNELEKEQRRLRMG